MGFCFLSMRAENGLSILCDDERSLRAMSQTHPHSQPILTSVAAHLYVRDLKVSAELFTQKLGFILDFVYGDPPFYGQVSRDNARLALRSMDEPVFAGDIREREDLLSASITLGSADEIQQLFVAYQAADVPFHQVLRKEPWGASTFIVQDPDGNLILFAAPSS
jgi:catechol 2,3-dioxygenase-like lactoylglutathione lyase family enzyme